MLDHNNWEVCETAALGLSLIGPEAINPLIQALESPNWQTRKAAVQALGWIGAGAMQAVPTLTQLFGDENQEVRATVPQTLTFITGQNFGEDAAAWQQWWETQS
jgi:HEAT repeat protein